MCDLRARCCNGRTQRDLFTTPATERWEGTCDEATLDASKWDNFAIDGDAAQAKVGNGHIKLRVATNSPQNAMTINDVAKLAGVSTATVSHVINNTRFVSDETRQKVLAAIDACGYTPNAHARSLAAGRSRMLGLIISDIANPFFPELVKSIEEKASARGYEVILSNTNYEPKRTVACVQRMLDQRASGVAILTSEMDVSLSQRLADEEVAVVFLDVGEVGPHTSNIVVDYEKGIREGVEHLLGLGHRRIAYISGPSHLKSAVRRKKAFVKIMKKYQASLHTTPLIFEGDFKTAGGQRAAAEVLRLEPRPTAILSGNDLMAIGALRELKTAGLRVPQDMSVIGFDDISFAALAQPPLTTILIPRSEIGENAVEALIHTIQAADNLGREFNVSAQLVVRESTGAAPPAKGKLKRKVG